MHGYTPLAGNLRSSALRHTLTILLMYSSSNTRHATVETLEWCPRGPLSSYILTTQSENLSRPIAWLSSSSSDSDE